MPGMNRKMPKKMRGGGMAKAKAMPLKRGGGVRSGGGKSASSGGKKVPRSLSESLKTLSTRKPSMEVSPAKRPDPIVPDESGGRKKLKPAPNKGAAMLPKNVRNKMGFMRNGGAVKKKSGGGVSKSAVRSSSKKPL